MAHTRLIWQLPALLVLASCATNPSAKPTEIPNTLVDNGTTQQASSPRPRPIVPIPPPVARQTKWVDLQVGDCLSTPPPSDPSIVEVTVVNCATQHVAEVFLRADVAVNAAIADVAEKQCATGLTRYATAPGHYLSTYLVDSNMDRTGHTPLPSAVICLLQSTDHTPLIGSARG